MLSRKPHHVGTRIPDIRYWYYIQLELSQNMYIRTRNQGEHRQQLLTHCLILWSRMKHLSNRRLQAIDRL